MSASEELLDRIAKIAGKIEVNGIKLLLNATVCGVKNRRYPPNIKYIIPKLLT